MNVEHEPIRASVPAVFENRSSRDLSAVIFGENVFGAGCDFSVGERQQQIQHDSQRQQSTPDPFLPSATVSAMRRLGQLSITLAGGLALGSFIALLRLDEPTSVATSPYAVDLPPTRAVELSNACAAASGRFYPNSHGLYSSSQVDSLVDSLPNANVPAIATELKYDDPFLFELPQGVIMSLGKATLGNKEYLRTLDSSGSIRLVGLRELVGSATRCWSLDRGSRPIEIVAGDARAFVDWLWYDFGYVDRNTIAQATLHIANLSDSEITASGFTSSCGCVRLSIPSGKRVELAPRGDLQLGVSIQFGDVDNLSQTLRLTLSSKDDASSADVVLGLYASTLPRPKCLPSQLDFGVVGRDPAGHSRRLRVVDPLTEELKIRSVTSDGPVPFAFQLTSRRRADGRNEHLVECAPVGSMPDVPGDLCGDIVLATSSKMWPAIRVPYRITGSQHVADSPSR